MFTYVEFKNIIDTHLNKDSQIKLLKTIAKNPERFNSNYRLTSLKDKLYQNILHSREIKFGQAMEDIFKLYMTKLGAIYLNNNSLDYSLNFDQLFQYKEHIVLIEQKMRDDHDSSKKKGQIENFKEKISYINNLKPTSCKKYCMWFIDPSMNKNHKYYIDVLSKEQLYYGKELAEFLNNINPSHNHIDFWELLEEYMIKYRESHNADFILNFEQEENIDYSSLTSGEIYKLLSHKEILSIISPNNKIYKEFYSAINNKPNTVAKRKSIDILIERGGNKVE